MDFAKDLKIFAVDDDIFYLSLLEQYIRNLGYDNITTFENGESCLNQLTEKPDVILLDYALDTLSGYDILKKIKRYDPNIYVVMVSGQDEITAAVELLKHGAFDYIQKGDSEEKKIKKVLSRIIEVKELLIKPQPGFLKKIFQM